jgi:hypothetical protein
LKLVKNLAVIVLQHSQKGAHKKGAYLALAPYLNQDLKSASYPPLNEVMGLLE